MTAAAPFLLATRSPHKLREIREILAPVGVWLIALGDLELPASPEEDEIEAFPTFRLNALAKARYFAATTGLITIADDSGLEVDALGGGPGVLTKRFSGRSDLSGLALDLANNELLLERLRDLPPNAGARATCAPPPSPRRAADRS